MATRKDYQVQITKISIDPDRFGRLHPVIWFYPIPHAAQSISRVHLSSIDQLLARGYAVGDQVHLSIVGDYPFLGRIILRVRDEDRWPLTTVPDYCHHCQRPLVMRDGQRYCREVSCPQTIYARLTYGVRALGLPFRREDISYLVWYRELVQDLPSLLFITAEDLAGDTDEGASYFDKDEAEALVEQTQEHVADLLNPHEPEMRFATQNTILDALSISGLYRADRRKLADHLYRGHWDWTNLPEIMTNPADLRRCGIAKADALAIARTARDRITELDGLARDF